MQSEDDRLKKKREEIQDLKDQIFNMSQKYDKLESQSSNTTAEVNELLFLLQRYPDSVKNKESIMQIQQRSVEEANRQMLSMRRQAAASKRLGDVSAIMEMS